MNFQFPHTIETITGERLTFLRIFVRDNVEFLEVENEVQPGAGPPMHIHHRQDESLTVVKGTLGYCELKGEKKFAGPGATVLFKSGIAHKFWNSGTDLLVCRGFVTPPDNLVYFLSEIYKSTNENGGRPGMYDSAFLLDRYKNEFTLLEIPSVVQKIIFPVILWLGNLFGKNKKFADAPAPVTTKSEMAFN